MSFAVLVYTHISLSIVVSFVRYEIGRRPVSRAAPADFSTILTLYRTRNRRRMQEGRGEAPHRPFGPWIFEIHRRHP